MLINGWFILNRFSMGKYFTIIIYILMLLISACGNNTPLTPEEQAAVDAANKMGIKYDMDDNMKLTISTQNFLDNMNIVSFRLTFQNITLNNTDFVGADFDVLFYSVDEGVDDDYPSFTFANVSGDGILLNAQFQGISIGSTIIIDQITFFDNNNNLVYFSNDEFDNNGLCYTDDLSTSQIEILLDEPIWNLSTNYCVEP